MNRQKRGGYGVGREQGDQDIGREGMGREEEGRWYEGNRRDKEAVILFTDLIYMV